jgi:hypothetical protein
MYTWHQGQSLSHTNAWQTRPQLNHEDLLVLQASHQL